MPRPLRVVCDDWSIEAGERELRLTPSWRTFRKCLAATAVAAMLMGGLVYYFGFPPGGGEVGADQRASAERDAEHREALREIDASLDAVAEAVGDEAFAAELERRGDASRAQLEADRERFERRREAVAAVGTIAYWLAFGVLVLIGVLPPLAVFWEKTILRADGTRALAVIRRGQLARAHRYPPGTFAQMVIEPRHIVSYSRNAGEIDRGWRWSVTLLPVEPAMHRPLILTPEWEPNPPLRPERLTRRVRQLARFLATATGIDEAVVVKDGKAIARLRTRAEPGAIDNA